MRLNSLSIPHKLKRKVFTCSRNVLSIKGVISVAIKCLDGAGIYRFCIYLISEACVEMRTML